MPDRDPAGPGGPPARPAILMIAGFGDNASMFDGLAGTDLAGDYTLIPVDLPGFGAPPLPGETTLDALASALAGAARRAGAGIVLAHSVASIVAALAARRADCPLHTILSLEGNLTADDAYFSGTAADHADPATFRAAFLARLDEMAAGSPVHARYRDNVATADPVALWQLGRDARRYSETCVPGDELLRAGRVVYLYDPPNCPQSTLDWLETSGMPRRRLPGASHWPSVDRPAQLAAEIRRALAG